MVRRVMIAVLWAFGQLPHCVRRRIVRFASPKYTVGALCIVQRDDGAVLLVRHSYKKRWGIVGGLAKPGEEPDVCAVREAREEAGIEVVLVDEPSALVFPNQRRVDIVFLGRPAPGTSAEDVSPRSAEILETRWFGPRELPELSSDTVSAWGGLARMGLIEPIGHHHG